jgi:hypothetical protein
MKYVFISLIQLFSFTADAQSLIQAMFYNVYRFPDRPPAQRELILKQIFNEYRPDLFMICELVSEKGADLILDKALQTPWNEYRRAGFNTLDMATDDPLYQMVFYNKSKLKLVRERVYPLPVRLLNHYTFVLNTTILPEDSVFLEVFVVHLKSSDGAQNQQVRLSMIEEFLQQLSKLPPDRAVLLAGDFNFYSADEPAYQKLCDSANPIAMEDPLEEPGNWHNNPAYQSVHTQSTRLSSEGFGIGGATGGMDDRFDFIMISSGLRHGYDLYYVPGSYQTLGNNHNCFDQRIDAYDCSGTYSLSLRKLLYQMSDHAPVVMQLGTDRTLEVQNSYVNRPRLVLPQGNMTSDFLEVSLTGMTVPSGSINIRISDLTGRACMWWQPKGQPSHNRVDVRSLRAGVYLIDIPELRSTPLKFLKR